LLHGFEPSLFGSGTVNGWDFSVHGISILRDGDCTFINCKFGGTLSSGLAFMIEENGSNRTNLTLQYCDLDGNGTNGQP